MRAIEKQMLDAIKSGESLNLGNTRVECDRTYDFEEMPAFDYADVYLHNNRIATVFRPATDEEYVAVDVPTLRRWPSRTTMSRLRALGVDVCTRKGEVYLHGYPLDRH